MGSLCDPDSNDRNPVWLRSLSARFAIALFSDMPKLSVFPGMTFVFNFIPAWLNDTEDRAEAQRDYIGPNRESHVENYIQRSVGDFRDKVLIV
jgi:hypothetical protein